MATRNPHESDPVTPYEKQAELKRILESKYFAKAPRRRRFLEFSSGQALQGEGDKLNEYLIGVEVYERGTDFDPQQDPIVRVQAHEIRRALKNYYQEEGKDSLLRIELPPGHYAPVFSRVSLESPDSSTPAGQAKHPATGARGEKSRWQRATILCLALGCAVLGFLFVRERTLSPHRGVPAAAMSEDQAWFWKPFLAPGSQPLVIVPTSPLLRLGTDADSAQTLRTGYTVPKSKLPEFHDTIHFRQLRNFTFVPTTTDYTGIGEALGLVHLLKLFASQGMTIRVKTSRLADYTEIQGGDTIMLGGATQWTVRVFSNPQGFLVSDGVVKNNHPGPGELSVYAPEFDPVTNRLVRDYALVLMAPNQTKQNRLLFLYGLYTQGTEAAAKYVTNDERLAELRKALLAASPDKKTTPPFFEALLSVPVENYVPGDASLLAVKITPE